MRPFYEQGFHEISWKVWPCVDREWREVCRLVSKSWREAIDVYPGSTTTDSDVVLTSSKILVVRNTTSDIYIRTGKRMCVFGLGMRCIETPNASTYVRNGTGRSRIYFSVKNGQIVGKINHTPTLTKSSL